VLFPVATQEALLSAADLDVQCLAVERVVLRVPVQRLGNVKETCAWVECNEAEVKQPV
jgi:hypothetical protein